MFSMTLVYIFCPYLIFTITLKSVNLIVVPDVTLSSLEEKSANSDVPQNFDTGEELLINQMQTLPCLYTFVTHNMNHEPSRIAVLLTDYYHPLSSAYLTFLQQFRSTFVITKAPNIAERQEYLLGVAVILRNHKDLINLKINLNNLCGRECRYAIILIDPFLNKNLFLKEAKTLIKLLWLKKSSNAVILGSVKESLMAAESYGFKPNILREPLDPVIVGECQTGYWSSKHEYFGSMKMNNCSVNVAYFDQSPYSRYVVYDNGPEFVGIEGRIIRIIAKSLNFTINTSVIQWGRKTSKFDEVSEEFASNRSIDFAIGGIIWNPDGNIDFTLAYDVIQLVWLVPKDIAAISMRGLVSPLSNDVWDAVGIVLCFAVILRLLLFAKLSLLELFALIIGSAWNKQPIKLSYRIIFMSWIIFGYILTQFYLASIAGNLLAGPKNNINTMADLVASKKKLAGVMSQRQLFYEAEDTSEDGIYQTIYKKFIVLEQDVYIKNLQDVITGVNKSFAIVGVLNVSSISTSIKFDSHVVHKVAETIISIPVGFATWHGIPFLAEIDKKIQRLVQGGIVSHLGGIISAKRRFIKRKKEDEEEYIENNFLRLRDIAPCFFLLLIGYFIGFLFLTVEIIIFELSKGKNQFRQPKKIMKKNKSKKIMVKQKIRKPINRAKIMK